MRTSAATGTTASERGVLNEDPRYNRDRTDGGAPTCGLGSIARCSCQAGRAGRGWEGAGGAEA